jgi:hypothetical protein
VFSAASGLAETAMNAISAVVSSALAAAAAF